LGASRRFVKVFPWVFLNLFWKPKATSWNAEADGRNFVRCGRDFGILGRDIPYENFLRFCGRGFGGFRVGGGISNRRA
jgi:hypothetical protein